MAVVVSLYGKADLKQIERAEKQLRNLKREVGSQGGAWSKFNANLDGIGTKMQGIGTGMSATLTPALVGGMALAVKSASDLEETMNKVNVVFGESADSVTKWSEGAAEAMGMSQQQAGEAAATFGTLLKATGKNEAETAKMSQSMVQLASDMSSFNNIPMADALDKIRAGLVGEAEPLRTVGVLLNEQTLKQRAVEMGLAKITDKTLPPAVKMQAAYAEILSQTKMQQGDFARTSDSLANSTRIASSQVKDMAASIGQDLIPLAKDALGIISPLIDKLSSMPDWLRKLLLGVGIAGAVAGPAIAGAGTVLRGISTIKGFAGSLKGGGGTVGVDKLGTSSSVAATEVATLGRAAATASGKTAVAGSGLGTLGGKAKTAGGQIGGAGSKAQTLVQPLHNLTGATKTASPQVRGFGKLAGTGSTKLGKFSGALGSSSVGAIAGVMGLEVALTYTIPKVMQAGDAFMQWMDALDTLNANRTSKKESAKDFRANVISDYGSVDAYLAHLAQKFGKNSTQYKNALYALGINTGTYNPATRWGGKQARGGDYWVTRPTLFLAGEAGPERATFTPQNSTPAAGSAVFTNCTFVAQDPRALVEDVTRGVCDELRRTASAGF